MCALQPQEQPTAFREKIWNERWDFWRGKYEKGAYIARGLRERYDPNILCFKFVEVSTDYLFIYLLFLNLSDMSLYLVNGFVV